MVLCVNGALCSRLAIPYAFFAITFSFFSIVTATPGVVLLKEEKMLSSLFSKETFRRVSEFCAYNDMYANAKSIRKQTLKIIGCICRFIAVNSAVVLNIISVSLPT
jgi:hypothetical protein